MEDDASRTGGSEHDSEIIVPRDLVFDNQMIGLIVGHLNKQSAMIYTVYPYNLWEADTVYQSLKPNDRAWRYDFGNGLTF